MKNKSYPRFVAPESLGLPDSLSSTPMFNLREVAEGLYVGGLVSPLAPIFDTIVALDGDPTDISYSRVRVLLPLHFHDGNPVPKEILRQAEQAMRGAEGPMLVHCALGQSRSVSVAYHLLRVLGFDHNEAFRRVLSPYGLPMRVTFDSVVRP